MEIHVLGWIVRTCDFDGQMSGIKFWKGDENLRHVYKKTDLRKIKWCSHFRLFSS
jgi:hypothetical protein